jgi:hypothetical protein
MGLSFWHLAIIGLLFGLPALIMGIIANAMIGSAKRKLSAFSRQPSDLGAVQR